MLQNRVIERSRTLWRRMQVVLGCRGTSSGHGTGLDYVDGQFGGVGAIKCCWDPPQLPKVLRKSALELGGCAKSTSQRDTSCN